MKSLFLSFFVLLSVHAVSASTLIITDVDDTVKVTDVLNKKNAVYNALFSKAAFSGMSQLYRELDVGGNVFYYISGSPTYIEEKVSNFLDYNNFPQKNNLILKNGMKTPTYDYKVAAISKVIRASTADKIILIGDDTEFDPEVYQAVDQNFPGRVESIYIRAVQNRKLPDLLIMKNFFSAVEIAGNEVLADHLNSDSLLRITHSFVLKDNGSKISIKNRYCPVKGRKEIEELKQRLTELQDIEAMELAQRSIIYNCKE